MFSMLKFNSMFKQAASLTLTISVQMTLSFGYYNMGLFNFVLHLRWQTLKHWVKQFIVFFVLAVLTMPAILLAENEGIYASRLQERQNSAMLYTKIYYEYSILCDKLYVRIIC